MDLNNHTEETIKDSSGLGRIFRENDSLKPPRLRRRTYVLWCLSSYVWMHLTCCVVYSDVFLQINALFASWLTYNYLFHLSHKTGNRHVFSGKKKAGFDVLLCLAVLGEPSDPSPWKQCSLEQGHFFTDWGKKTALFCWEGDLKGPEWEEEPPCAERKLSPGCRGGPRSQACSVYSMDPKISAILLYCTPKAIKAFLIIPPLRTSFSYFSDYETKHQKPA